MVSLDLPPVLLFFETVKYCLLVVTDCFCFISDSKLADCLLEKIFVCEKKLKRPRYPSTPERTPVTLRKARISTAGYSPFTFNPNQTQYSSWNEEAAEKRNDEDVARIMVTKTEAPSSFPSETAPPRTLPGLNHCIVYDLVFSSFAYKYRSR
jgi:hypothetical protein